MSRTVIHDVVIPVVQRIMQRDRFIGSDTVIMDSALEEFLEEAMRMYFGVIGANECQHLKEQLEEAMKNDPFAFEEFIRQLLRKYVKLQVKLRDIIKQRKTDIKGPPDRFADQRRRYELLFGRQDDQ